MSLFKHRLALQLGRTVAELEATVSNQEFQNWLHFYELEPFGYVAKTYDSAHLKSIICNASGNYKETIKPESFLPDSLQPKRFLTENMLKAQIEKS